MANQKKRLGQEISEINTEAVKVIKKVERNLPSVEAKVPETENLPFESSFTDSTMYSSDGKNLNRKMTKYVKNGKELMKEDITQSQKSQIKASREELSTAYESDYRQKSEMQLTLKTERRPAINQEQFDKKHGYRRVK
ncbi:unnamed protein product [Brugia timori]|uniref:Uncharacterized protein n=1 Tax=Brugia timori TaxID=42155 RepID=A0A0R3R427_9BILA|nr:unnamed protein product [Brugia timori]